MFTGFCNCFVIVAGARILVSSLSLYLRDDPGPSVMFPSEVTGMMLGDTAM